MQKGEIQRSTGVKTLFISNVFPNFTVEDMYNHVKDLGVSVNDLYQRSHPPESKRKSYVLEISSRDAPKVLSEYEWPMGYMHGNTQRGIINHNFHSLVSCK